MFTYVAAVLALKGEKRTKRVELVRFSGTYLLKIHVFREFPGVLMATREASGVPFLRQDEA